MRILQVFNRYLERGGEETSVERVSDALSMHHSVFHCYFDSRQLGTTEGFMDSAAAAVSMIWSGLSASRLRSHALVTKSDVLLLHNIFPVGTASLLHEIGKMEIPAVSYIHNFRPYSVNGYLWANDRIVTAGLRKNFIPEILAGSWQSSRIKTALYASIITGMHWGRLFRHVKAWIAISEFMREKFIEAGVQEDLITTIPHSWDPLPSPPTPEDGGYYLFLGRLTSAKGIRLLFQTWEILEHKLGSKTPRLIIAGEGPLRAEVEGKSARSNFVEYAGLVDSEVKAGLIQGCRAMIAPSLWWEPLGLVTYEAYDFSKPMLAAASGGLSETVQHGITGMLHRPGDAEELAEQVLALDSDESRRVEMGRKGREWLLVNTKREDWLQKFDSVLNRVTDQRAKRKK
jgi:glycosyltransferase involved in cell wall biosynthesis